MKLYFHPITLNPVIDNLHKFTYYKDNNNILYLSSYSNDDNITPTIFEAFRSQFNIHEWKASKKLVLQQLELITLNAIELNIDKIIDTLEILSIKRIHYDDYYLVKSATTKYGYYLSTDSLLNAIKMGKIKDTYITGEFKATNNRNIPYLVCN